MTPFIQLLDGSEYFFDGREQPPPSIQVIAHSLSCINRFAGHTLRPYSVAEHSCLCYEIAQVNWPQDPLLQLAALMHDAAECITGDLSSPIKRLIRAAWSKIEYPVETHLFSSFGLLETFQRHAELIKQIDLTALWIERRDLLPGGTGLPLRTPWDILDRNFLPLPAQLKLRQHGESWGNWLDRFIETFNEISAKIPQNLGN